MTEESVKTELYSHYEVKVCTAECLYSGIMQCSISQRLIDAINEGVLCGSSSRSLHFLPLSKVICVGGTDDGASFAELFITKANIIFIASGEHEVKEKILTSYPYRQKQSMPVNILAIPYSIQGKIHIDTWGQLEDAIESDTPFFPMTDARITPAASVGQDYFAFMALNRTRIIHLNREA